MIDDISHDFFCSLWMVWRLPLLQWLLLGSRRGSSFADCLSRRNHRMLCRPVRVMLILHRTSRSRWKMLSLMERSWRRCANAAQPWHLPSIYLVIYLVCGHTRLEGSRGSLFTTRQMTTTGLNGMIHEETYLCISCSHHSSFETIHTWTVDILLIKGISFVTDTLRNSAFSDPIGNDVWLIWDWPLVWLYRVEIPGHINKKNPVGFIG